MIVVQTLGVGLGAGGVAELDFRELLGGLDHEVLMTEAVGEDDVAAVVRQLGGGVVALLALGDVGLEHIVRDAQSLAGSLGTVDEVQVIGGVFIVQEDETDLDITGGGAGILGGSVVSGLFGLGVVPSAGGQAQDHDQGKEQCKKLLHSVFLLQNSWNRWTGLTGMTSSNAIIQVPGKKFN